MNIDHISHSQINMWQRCPMQWEFRYVMGLKEPPSAALFEGGCYHKTLEFYFNQKIKTGRDLPLDDCLDLFATVWDDRLQMDERIDWGDKKPHLVKDEGIRLIGAYRTEVSSKITPVMVEKHFDAKVAGVKFVLIMDLLDDKGIAIDHKTASRSYTQDRIDRDLQASATAFALERPIEFHNHVAVKALNPHIQILKTYRALEDIEWWILMTAKIIAQMKSGIAPPRPTDWWCGPKWCGYFERCRGKLMRRKA